MELVQLVDFQAHGDERGTLVSLESAKNIPFEIKRVYYMFDTQSDVARGFHAHKKLKQAAICISGNCTMLLDDGLRKESVVLSSPKQAVLIDPMVWHEMSDFSENCILLVLADDIYDENDYIRDYDDFIRRCQK